MTNLPFPILPVLNWPKHITAENNWPDNQDYAHACCKACGEPFLGPKRAPACWQCHSAASEIETMDKFVSPEPLPTPYEREVLTVLAEECAEVTQRATKMIRFGVIEIQPGQPHSNRDRLSDEVGHILAMIETCQNAGLLDEKIIQSSREKKRYKLAKYLQCAPETK